MSVENNTTADPNIGDNKAPKPGGIKKILGGIGCLLLIAIIIGVVVSLQLAKTGAVSEEARSFVQGSTVVQKYLGSPIVIKEERGTPGSDKSFVYEFDISGPEGTGTATVNMTREDKNSPLILGESSLDFNGEIIDLDAKDEFNLDVEGMDDF